MISVTLPLANEMRRFLNELRAVGYGYRFVYYRNGHLADRSLILSQNSERYQILTRMELLRLILLRVSYFDYYIYLIWTLCNGLLLYCKLDFLKIPKLLVVTAYFTMIITFSIKLHLVHWRHFTSNISKLTQFFLLTILIQMPLVSFFFNFSILLSTPLEIILHVLLLLMILVEGLTSFIAVWKAVKHDSAQCPPHAAYPSLLSGQ